MKADILSILTAKAMNLELPTRNNDAITSSDIAHFLGTKNLDNREYDMLIAKYTDNDYARSMLFDDIYEDSCSIFLKYMKPKELLEDRFLMRHLINLALREVTMSVIQNSDYFSMIDSMDGIIALAYENESDDGS